MLPSRTSVSYDVGRLIGSGFSKTLVAVWSEKRVSSRGFENGTPLNFRCACHGRSPAHNRSISRNERPSSNVTIQLPSFPFGCYTNPNNKCAPSLDHCICCFLQNRLLTTSFTVDSTNPVAIGSPLRYRSP